MEKTLCQRCFHYNACCAIDLTGALGNPEHENIECEHFIDSDRVKIQDTAYWSEHIKTYTGNDIYIFYYCSHCGQKESVKIYSLAEWDEYYSEHYREKVKLPEFCKVCGSVMTGIFRNED